MPDPLLRWLIFCQERQIELTARQHSENLPLLAKVLQVLLDTHQAQNSSKHSSAANFRIPANSWTPSSANFQQTFVTYQLYLEERTTPLAYLPTFIHFSN